MDGQISVKTLLVGALAALALLAAYLVGSAGEGAAAAGEPAGKRTLTMRGTGEAVAVPDQVTFDLSVTLKRPALETALADASAAMEKVLKSLEKLGVARKDVQTTGLSMSPEYDYPQYGPPVLTGYRVNERAAVLVRELKAAGKAVSAAVDAGGNAVRVGDIALKIGDPEAALAKARTAAVEQATAKAEEYADATGQDLGEVATLREVSAEANSAINEQSMRFGRAIAAADSLSNLKAVPVRAGRSDLSVVIEVVWELG